MESDAKIFVAGHRGLVGSAIVKELNFRGYKNLILIDKEKLDLRNQSDVKSFFESSQIDYVFLAAAKVGGINWNKNNPADFIYDNLQIQNNVIHYSSIYGIKKLMFLGSACVYPKITPQPIKEEYLLSDYLEPTNEGYALAKIAGLKMCQFYRSQYGFNTISVMPTNLYGVNDNFNLEQCHVIPAMIRKFLDAKNNGLSEVILFGDGTPTREFLYVDDLANACVKLMNEYNDPQHINIGAGQEYSIKELAEIVSSAVEYNGSILWNTDKPNGTPRRQLDVSRLTELGWTPKVSLEEGIRKTIKWYMEVSENV
jgi:GDP-L-fucose synthase